MLNFSLVLACVCISFLGGFIFGLLLKDTLKLQNLSESSTMKISLEVVNLSKVETNDDFTDVTYYEIPVETKGKPEYRRALKAYAAQLPESQDKKIKPYIDC